MATIEAHLGGPRIYDVPRPPLRERMRQAVKHDFEQVQTASQQVIESARQTARTIVDFAQAQSRKETKQIGAIPVTSADIAALEELQPDQSDAWGLDYLISGPATETKGRPAVEDPAAVAKAQALKELGVSPSLPLPDDTDRQLLAFITGGHSDEHVTAMHAETLAPLSSHPPQDADSSGRTKAIINALTGKRPSIVFASKVELNSQERSPKPHVKIVKRQPKLIERQVGETVHSQRRAA